MENPAKTNDVDHDRRLHSLYRMGFESARLEYGTSRASISDNWCYDWEFRHMDGCREQIGTEVITTANKGRTLMLTKIWKYFKRIWCAVLNKKCSDDCDCNV
tara:strand:- start:284 stop:589 length:306 start_codon:yes stop_codon:yes gene_type:complete